MDSSYSLLLDALRKMELRLGEVIDGRGVGPERLFTTSGQSAVMHTGVGGPVFDRAPFDDAGPAFDPEPFYDGPIFDEDPFVDSVCDDAPDSDNAAVTVLKLPKSACVVHDQGDSDDPNGGPVFDTYTNHLGEGHVFGSEVVFTIDKSEYVAELAVFEEEPEHEEEALTTNITASTGTNTQGSGAAGCEWRQEQFNADVGVLVPVHDIATASQMRFRLVLSDSVETDGVDVIQCWDPGLLDGSPYLVVAWSYADVYLAYFSGLAINPLTQQKCGGCHGRDSDCMMLACDHLQSVDRVIFIVRVDSSVAGQLEAFAVDSFNVSVSHTQRCLLMSEAVKLGVKFSETWRIRSPIQDYHVPILIVSCSSDSFSVIAFADKLCDSSLLPNYLLVHMETDDQKVSLGFNFQVEAKLVHSLHASSSQAYRLSEIKGNLLDLGRQRIGIMDDSAYNVYQLVLEICSYEGVLGVFLIAVTNRFNIVDSAFIYSSQAVGLQGILSVMQWFVVVEFLCTSLGATGQCCSNLSAVPIQGEKFPKTMSMAILVQGHHVMDNGPHHLDIIPGYAWLEWVSLLSALGYNSECSLVCLRLRDTNIVALNCINCVRFIWIISSVGGMLLNGCVQNLSQISNDAQEYDWLDWYSLMTVHCGASWLAFSNEWNPDGLKAISRNSVSFLEFSSREQASSASAVVFQWILFQLVIGELVQLGYVTEYNFLWMSGRSTVASMVSLRSYSHYYNDQENFSHLNDQKCCMVCPKPEYVKARYPGVVKSWAIPQSAAQGVLLAFIDGFLKSEKAWQIWDMVLLDMMPEKEGKQIIAGYKLLLICSKVGLVTLSGKRSVENSGASILEFSGFYSVHAELAMHEGIQHTVSEIARLAVSKNTRVIQGAQSQHDAEELTHVCFMTDQDVAIGDYCSYPSDVIHAKLYGFLSSPATLHVEYLKSMRLIGQIQGTAVLILLNPGSPHTLASNSLAAQLNSISDWPQPFLVIVVNGTTINCEQQFLYVQWEEFDNSAIQRILCKPQEGTLMQVYEAFDKEFQWDSYGGDPSNRKETDAAECKQELFCIRQDEVLWSVIKWTWKLEFLAYWRLLPRFIDLPAWGQAAAKGGGDVRYAVLERLKG